ncbi:MULTISPECIES: hypothetical protein [Brevibacillus]|uniref:hypothetical protein n=1 Tax=Brevibacillus TaxID=55080 RepID=UPI0036405152
MKKAYILIFSLIGIFALSNLIYFPGLKVWAFDELALFDKQKIISLTIIKNKENEKNEKVEITDPAEIQKVLNDFSKMELRKMKSASDANDSGMKEGKENVYTYTIDIYEKKQDIGTIYLSGTTYMVFYDNSSSNDIPVYKIENNPDLEIHEVFNSAKSK